MKKIQLFLVVAVLLLSSCGGNNVQQQQPPVPGFDIQAFNGLLSRTSNPDALQQAINTPGNNINNLDLDNDGSIDYLKVDQISATQIQVVDEVGNDPNQRTVLATLNINQGNNSYSIQGNQQYCGDTYVYNSPSGITFGQYMFLSWALSPHPYYHPYWGYHRGYYRGYSSYHSHYRTPYNPGYIQQRKTTTTTKTTTANNQRPQQKTYTPVTPQRSSLANPNQSQRQYQVNTQNTGGQVKSSFGGSKTSSSPSASSSGSRSYGGSKSSFGGSHSSSSSHSSSGRRR